VATCFSLPVMELVQFPLEESMAEEGLFTSLQAESPVREANPPVVLSS